MPTLNILMASENQKKRCTLKDCIGSIRVPQASLDQISEIIQDYF